MPARLRRPLTLLPLLNAAILATALLLAPAASSAESSPQQPSRGGKCHLSIAAPPQITAGETTTLSGQLQCPSDRSAAGEAVTVYQRERSAGSALSEVGTASTEADGSYQLTLPAFAADSIFYVRAQAALGAHTLVRVAPEVTIAGPAAGAQLFTRGERLSDGSGDALTFTGTVTPAGSDAVVALQREYAASGEQWRTIARADVGAEGQYSITHSFRSAGQVSVRVVAHPRGPDVEAASEALSYDIAQAQNPQLTIESSVDPVSPGQSVTIAGVAAGAANQSVTLLARTTGHEFVAVAKAAAGAGGAYTFTESPVQTTFYRVLDSSARSTELAQGCKYALTAQAAPSTEQAGELLARAGEQETFSGTVTPAPIGHVVYLERENPSGVGFHVLAAGTVDASGSYSIAYTFSALATNVIRITVPPSPESEGSTSEPFTFLVAPDSSPAASEDPAGG
jgi:hypothetical protein